MCQARCKRFDVLLDLVNVFVEFSHINIKFLLPLITEILGEGQRFVEAIVEVLGELVLVTSDDLFRVTSEALTTHISETIVVLRAPRSVCFSCLHKSSSVVRKLSHFPSTKVEQIRISEPMA